MSETDVTLAIIGLAILPEPFKRGLAPLTVEQLALCAAPNLRSINELARHIIAVRAAQVGSMVSWTKAVKTSVPSLSGICPIARHARRVNS